MYCLASAGLGARFGIASVSIHIMPPSLGMVHAMGWPASARTAAACSPTAGTTQKSSLARPLFTEERESRIPDTWGFKERTFLFSSESCTGDSLYGSDSLPDARLRTPIDGRYQSHRPTFPLTFDDQRMEKDSTSLADRYLVL